MKNVVLLAALLMLACAPVWAQTCQPPTIVANAKAYNLFTPAQEMVLGRLTEQKLAGEFKEIYDPVLLAYIEDLGNKIIKHLPQTGLKFKFHIIDYPQANAFNIPGGHIYVSRKLIAFVSSEDELAGVIGHELGHATVHHGAIDLSSSLSKVLKVTSLGDEKDIAEKYNLLIENARTKKASAPRGHEDDQQMEADKIGFYAMVAAGYDPNAMFSFFDRLTESKGKTGSWVSDLFGGGNPDQKRLREIQKATGELPRGCIDGRSAKASEEFAKWQTDVVMFHDTGRKEMLPGLIGRKDLAPRLRSDVRNLTFSKDGNLLLAQDEAAVSVIDVPTRKVLFQIPASDAGNAMITPDDQSVVFVTNNLRFERWSIPEKKNTGARELTLRGNCWEHTLSPDGNFLACVDTSSSINVIDTRTGKKVWEKKKFYELSYFEYIFWLLDDSNSGTGFYRIHFTPDSKYVLFSRSNKFRFRFAVNGITVQGSDDAAMALDLASLKETSIGGDLKRVASRPYDFIDPTHVLGTTEPKLDSGGIFTFPEGKRVNKLTFGAEAIKIADNPNYAILKPLKNAQLGIYDIKANILDGGLDKADLAIWNDVSATESATGVVLLQQVSYDPEKKRFNSKEVGSIEIPAADIGSVESAEVSDNFRFLSLSSKTRGGLWDLSTGERIMYTLGFRSAMVDEFGNAVAEFPLTSMNPAHSLVLIDPKAKSTNPLRKVQDYGARQYGRFVLTRTSLDPGTKKSDDETENSDETKEKNAESQLRKNVHFELRDWLKDEVVWTRDFKDGVPRYSFDAYSGRLIFYWWLGGDEGKTFANSDPHIKQQAEALGDKADDYIIEVVDAFQKKTVGTFGLETGKGSFSVRQGRSEGDWLLVRDDEGRVLVYSIKSGQLRYRYFGNAATLDPTGAHLLVQNFPGELTLYDLNTGDPQAKFVTNGNGLLLRFNLSGDKLFVFTDKQTAYTFDLKKLPKPEEMLGVR